MDKVCSLIEIMGLSFFVYLVLRFAEDAPHPCPLPTEGEGMCLVPERLAGLGRLLNRALARKLLSRLWRKRQPARRNMLARTGGANMLHLRRGYLGTGESGRVREEAIRRCARIC